MSIATRILGLIALPTLSFFLTYLCLRIYKRYAENRGLTAPDVHKLDQPQVVKDSGNILPLLLLLLFLPPFFIEGISGGFRLPLGIFLTALIGFGVGFIDDTRDLGLIKVPLMLIAGLPLTLLDLFIPYPRFPLIGRARMTILYPIFGSAVVVAVISNGVNMIDVVNGSAIIQSVFSMLTIIVWSSILFFLGAGPTRNMTYILYALLILGILFGFFSLNKYPAKIFLGNTGAYGIGAMLAALILISRKEFVAMVSFLPTILNAFIILASLGKLKTKEDFPSPVRIRAGKIFPNKTKGAPLTLVGLRAAAQSGQGVEERQVIRFFTLLFLLAFLLSLLTGIFIYFAGSLHPLPL